jgi:hypothetical protein
MDTSTLVFNDLHDFLCSLLNYIDSDIPLISFISLLTSPLSIAYSVLQVGFWLQGHGQQYGAGLVRLAWLGWAYRVVILSSYTSAHLAF